ncbi:hypothetical protein [uncultured Arcticibacterium sp.]|uniref:hypothetical protein n=1 Tax=uncultured Arcticibacterium sp. TaxID=2173042 RepID=UPI0030FCB82F
MNSKRTKPDLVNSVHQKKHQDWWTNLSIDEKEEIKIGLTQADKGNVLSNKTVMKRFHKWHS